MQVQVYLTDDVRQPIDWCIWQEEFSYQHVFNELTVQCTVKGQDIRLRAFFDRQLLSSILEEQHFLYPLMTHLTQCNSTRTKWLHYRAPERE